MLRLQTEQSSTLNQTFYLAKSSSAQIFADSTLELWPHTWCGQWIIAQYLVWTMVGLQSPLVSLKQRWSWLVFPWITWRQTHLSFWIYVYHSLDPYHNHTGWFCSQCLILALLLTMTILFLDLLKRSCPSLPLNHSSWTFIGAQLHLQLCFRKYSFFHNSKEFFPL